VKNLLSRMCVYMMRLQMNFFFFPCQDAYFLNSMSYIFFLSGVKWKSEIFFFFRAIRFFFFHFLPLKRRIFLHFNAIFFFFFLPEVKWESKKFIVRKVRIHDVLQNELFFFSTFYPVKMHISSIHSFLFFS
jgi:hypothetical protein